jgi:glutamyl-tRNA reductase
VEPSANQLENVYVYDLDDLEQVAARNRGLREAEVAEAEGIVEQELKAFLAQLRERRAVPVLAQLRAHAEALARAETERTLAGLPGLDDRQQKSVRAMAAAIVNKLLHAPTAKLREEGEGPLGEAAAALFGLEQTGPTPVPTPVPDPQPEPVPEPEPAPGDHAVLPLTRKR